MFRTKPAIAVSAMLACLLAPLGVHADPELDKAIEHGKQLFLQNTFGGKGRVCQSCHLAGGTKPGQLPNGQAIPSLSNAAAIFPRYNKRIGKVVTLEDQVRNCVMNALEGTPPEYGGEDMNALVSYLTSLSNGKPIEMGGAPK